MCGFTITHTHTNTLLKHVQPSINGRNSGRNSGSWKEVIVETAQELLWKPETLAWNFSSMYL